MKHNKYTEHAIDGPYTTRPSRADKVLFWLSGFVAGFLFAILVMGK
jgi:hypothetical protein